MLHIVGGGILGFIIFLLNLESPGGKMCIKVC